METAIAALTYQPIGQVHSPYLRRIDAPHQATVVAGTESGHAAEATLELDPALPEETLRDLEGFSRIWVLFAFHRSHGWAATVRPPRGPRVKRGVFATRSPHRPNAIGLSCVELVAVEGRTLRIRGMDLLDGTPVLDIKPYVPYADAFPEARAGWIDLVDAASGHRSAPGPRRPRGCRPAGREAR
jgi:tRNA-Thr(GGU) m(6)t(6)A37 methyltransferase TsaA